MCVNSVRLLNLKKLPEHTHCLHLQCNMQNTTRVEQPYPPLSSKTWSAMPSSGQTRTLHCKTPAPNVKEEGKLEAAEQMSRKTGSSAGHHLPSDQPNAGTTATSAERHRLEHINPHVDTHKTIIQHASVHAQTCAYTHGCTTCNGGKWGEMGTGERERERKMKDKERQSKWQDRKLNQGQRVVFIILWKRSPEQQTATRTHTHTHRPDGMKDA